MEDFEEMKLYWNQLAEKNNVDSETNKKILEAIKSNKYKSLTGRMIKENVIGMIVIVALMVFLALDRYRFHSAADSHIVVFILSEVLGLMAFLCNFSKIILLDRLDYAEGTNKLRKKVKSVKKFKTITDYSALAVVVIYIGAILYFDSWMFQYTRVIVTGIIVIIIAICVIYLSFRYDSKQMKQLENFIDEE